MAELNYYERPLFNHSHQAVWDKYNTPDNPLKLLSIDSNGMALVEFEDNTRKFVTHDLE